MQITHITSDRREVWNKFVAQEPSFALLQSWEWGEFKESLGWQAFRIAVEDCGQILAGAQLLIKTLPMKLVSIAYVPRGPVGNWLNESIAPLLLAELHKVSKSHRAVFLKIEPPLIHDPAINQTLKNYDFRSSRYTNQPQATILLDLRPDLDNILGQMRKKTRQYIRQASKKGVVVRTGNQDDLPAFHELMQLTGQRGEFTPRTFEYYQNEWKTFNDVSQTVLLMAFYNDQLLAVRTAYHCGSHAAEFHAGSSNEYLDLRANYLLVWEAIKWAKAHGCHTYDLWGIPAEAGQAVHEGKDPPVSNRTDGLWGVYRFKRGFSKDMVYYTGAYDYVYSPFLYSMLTNKFFDADMMDQVATKIDSMF